MGFYSKSSTNFLLHYSIFFFFEIITSILIFSTTTNSIYFNFPSFPANDTRIIFDGESARNVDRDFIEVTSISAGGTGREIAGRATYSEAIQLWDATTGRQTDFDTHFSFIIDRQDRTYPHNADGLTFFLAPFGSMLPGDSWGGALGLLPRKVSETNLTTNPIVAVEFDSNKNGQDPSTDHVGINVNSVVSVDTVSLENGTISDGRKADAWISYKSATKNLSVYLSYADNPVSNGSYTLSHVVDLSKVLPELITVGFSAATGTYTELHNVLSWKFNSTLELRKDNKTDEGNTYQNIPTEITEEKGNTLGLIVGLVVGLGVLVCGIGFGLFIWLKKRRSSSNIEDDAANSDMSMDDEFEKGTGPRKFSYRELATATNNFEGGGKLGEGGFGGVYKGLLSDNTYVAVKRVSKGSHQGKKEYQSEVRIISRLRHRNLVQLIGWCHEKSELLLVYEFMPNRSLDNHLFRGENVLTWEVRYKIALGIASALLYLHEEWEQCIVHRDIKSSNVMLDSNFNAKLGDFGLARLVDHGLGSQTTVLAGTMGYLAPECVTTGKSSKESDVYSFGIVALEIACGRKPVEVTVGVSLVEWVWELYGTGNIIEAADEKLIMDFDEQQMQHLMILGLWCAHPDHKARPSIRQVINILNFESPLPNLPPKMPTPVYYSLPIQMCKHFHGDLTNSQTDGSQCTCSSCAYTSSSQVAASSTSSSLLHSR
ncbi:L-type lectin-domain containing receptor kinase IX.1-like [Papaver somniferum]|uniref:L-type lectin-domain containing receptor kinase IX.1-like n=1 Tax=Papaver somniferum TaxID=3469 RepID=UPI000E700EED|nr:L-type lectin-domain containing receptor kinase IX.1-like [Papaver somniferum]